PSDHEDGDAPVLDLRHYAEHSFVGFTRHHGPAYFDQSIHLCHRAGFSPRIRYEASTVYGVLDLVGAGLGVALVPASAALLGVRGVRLQPLLGKDPSEVLSLLHRKADSHPVLPLLEESVGLVFAAMREKLSAAGGPPQGG
ncbi:MAG TPA: LysR family substrate-binding domain-containing protein, partial [Burkholderiaceae bacterium]|nr:LysR family substrate-binding domain-containing protein [Burkholderiaceae bacterium]